MKIQSKVRLPKLVYSEINSLAAANRKSYQDTVRALLHAALQIAATSLEPNGRVIVKEGRRETELEMFKGAKAHLDFAKADLRVVTVIGYDILLGLPLSGLLMQIAVTARMKPDDVFRELLKIALVVSKIPEPGGVFMHLPMTTTDARVSIF